MANEKVLIVHEDEAGVLLHVVCEHVKRTHYDLSDEEQECDLKWMLDLKKKLTLYLDNELVKDVTTV